MDKQKFNEAVGLLTASVVEGDAPEVKQMITLLNQYKRHRSVPSWFLLYTKALCKIKGLPEFEYEVERKIGDYEVYYALNMNEVRKLGLIMNTAYLNFYSTSDESFIKSSAQDYFDNQHVRAEKFVVMYQRYLWFVPEGTFNNGEKDSSNKEESTAEQADLQPV